MLDKNIPGLGVLYGPRILSGYSCAKNYVITCAVWLVLRRSNDDHSWRIQR